MTKINITVDGSNEREYKFQTLDEEDANEIVNLILSQTDRLIVLLDKIGSISAEDPPEFEEQ